MTKFSERHETGNGFTGYNAAWTQPRQSFNFARAIGFHAEIEARCDAQIQRQDELIRAITNRLPRGNGETAPVLSWPDEQIDSASDLVLPLAAESFLNAASVEDISAIETLEIEIAQLRKQMGEIERAIIGQSPLTPTDTARKMKFLAAFVANGGEMDLETLARIVETGADMLLTSLGEVGYL